MKSRTTVVTSFGERQADAYAWAFVDSFNEFWPGCADLMIYHEGGSSARFGGLDLMQIPACARFLKRNADRNGVGPDGEYNFRMDAFKFCRKVFAQADAAERIGSGRMLWLDADVVTLQRVPEELMQFLLDDRDTITFLSRKKPTSECGFIGYNLDVREVRLFLQAFAREYATDHVLSRDEYHDSYVFDRLMEERGIPGRSLARWPQSKVFADSILGVYMHHFKGQGKRSKLQDVLGITK